VDTRGSPGQAASHQLSLVNELLENVRRLRPTTAWNAQVVRSFPHAASTTVDPDKRLALTRRKYWHDMYTAAVLGNDETTAGHALRFVQHYDQLLALIKGEQQ
jgi:hypothetical protein